MSCEGQFAGGLLGRLFPSWRNIQGRNSSSSYRGLCRAQVVANPYSWYPSNLLSSRPSRWRWSAGLSVELLGPIHTGGPSPLPSLRVLSRGTCLSCFGAMERWLEPGAMRLPDAGWSSRRVSVSYLSRVRISSWPLRARRKPHLSPTRVHWVYIFIPLRTGLGYTFFLRWTLSPTLNKTKCIFTCS